MSDRDVQDLVEEFIVLACKGDHQKLNEIFNRIILDYDIQHQGLILSGLAGAIHEFNLQIHRGHLQN